MAIPNPAKISAQVLEDVIGRLSDPVIGFNTQLAVTIQADPRYAANAAFLLSNPQAQLVFPANYVGVSPNVLLAPLAIDDWIKTSPASDYQSILMNVYTQNAIATPTLQATKGLVFDGKVNIGVDIHIGWPANRVTYDFDAAMSAVEDTMYTIFNTVLPSIPYQVWSNGVVWNGIMSVPVRSDMIIGKGVGFRQMTSFTLNFGLQKK